MISIVFKEKASNNKLWCKFVASERIYDVLD